MLNKLTAFMSKYHMVQPGDQVVCAVSGGADSMALLWAMYLLKDKLQIELSAAHFNHRLRDSESDRDEAFVRDFCNGFGIPFTAGSSQVTTGAKGLEAAARDARYAFLRSLPGKIATAHTADDNAETIVMHLVRGTGLKGLGGISPVNGQLIRPMLNVTRVDVLAFLQEYSVPYVEDSTNFEDDFLRNRLRHHVMPLLKQENPSLSRNLSAMALRLRQDESALETIAEKKKTDRVSVLRALEPGIRNRVLANYLLDAGVREPEAEHIRALEKLIFSEKPSGKAHFPAGVTIARNYDTLELRCQEKELACREVLIPGVTPLPELGMQIVCREPNPLEKNTSDSFSVVPVGKVLVRSRVAGDTMRLHGGTKSLKKLFIDKKIPAAQRSEIPVIVDTQGVLGVAGFGGNLDRLSDEGNAVRICIEYL